MDTAEVRVMSYNVRSLRDDRDALTRVIRGCAPDILCVQEAPRLLRWRQAAARLARDCGLVVITGGATAGGSLLLGSLRVTVHGVRDLPFPQTPGMHRRGLAAASVSVAGARFAVGGIHLGVDAATRPGQARLALDGLAAFGAAHQVLAGDFHEGPDRPARTLIAGELRDAYELAPTGSPYTAPRRDPSGRPDAVFVSKDVEVDACGVPDGVADVDYAAAAAHRPVLARLRVPVG